MLSTLCVSEVGAVILVDSQAQTTFERADVVLEEVWVLVEVDCLEREFAEALTTVCVRGTMGGDPAAAELRTCAILRPWLATGQALKGFSLTW